MTLSDEKVTDDGDDMFEKVYDDGITLEKVSNDGDDIFEKVSDYAKDIFEQAYNDYVMSYLKKF